MTAPCRLASLCKDSKASSRGNYFPAGLCTARCEMTAGWEDANFVHVFSRFFKRGAEVGPMFVSSCLDWRSQLVGIFA